MSPPLPTGYAVRLDPQTRRPAPDVLVGGSPLRVLRLTATGQQALDELSTGPVISRASAVLARRLTDGGLAHPVPPRVRAAITIVIPVHGRAELLERCLTALGGRHRTVVVDDGSPDAARVRAVAERHDAEVVRRERNAGPGAARNFGLRQADTDVVAFVDSDTEPSPAALEFLAAHLLDPLVGAVAPRIVASAGSSASGRPTAGRCPLDLGPRPADVRPYTAVSYVPSAVLVARRAMLVELGGFAEDLRYGEDVDLVWRLIAAGWRVRYEPELTIPHLEPRTWRALLRRRFHYGTSAAPLAVRHPANTAPLLLHPWFATTVAALLAGRPAAAAAAFTAGVVTTARRAGRAGLPGSTVLRGCGAGVRQTWLGIGRYGVQFACPLLVGLALTGSPRRRLAVLSLLLGPAVTTWTGTGRRVGAIPFGPAVLEVLAVLADEIAYGAGVYAGCLHHKTIRPLRPKLVRKGSA